MEERLGAPALLASRAVELGDFFGAVEQQYQGVIGHFADAKVGQVTDHHAVPRGRVQVDGVHAHAVPNDHFQLRRAGKHLFCVRLAAAQPHVRVADRFQHLGGCPAPAAQEHLNVGHVERFHLFHESVARFPPGMHYDFPFHSLFPPGLSVLTN